MLENPQTRLNYMCEGVGYFGDINVLDAIVELPDISRDSYQTVMFKPVCGLFNQSKYLPLRNMPIEVELELADYDAPITTTLNDVFTAPNTSISWRIQHCQITCDSLTLDNSLDDSDVNHSLGGNTLQLVYDTYISSIQTITSADTQVNVSRSLTALRSVLMSFDKPFTADRIKWHNKSWNTFYSTMLGNRNGPINYVNVANEIKHLQLTIGSKLYPECPNSSHAECFYSLRKSLGVLSNHLHALDITGDDYRSNKLVVGVDTDRMLGLAFTGASTKNKLMTIKLKTNTGDYQASRMHIVLVAHQVLEVSDTGVCFRKY